METKHTPGPWRVVNYQDKHDVPRVVSDKGGIAVLCINRYLGAAGPSKQEQINAALIAAAPELLEALKEIAELNTMYPPNYNTMTEAQKCEWTHYGKFAVIARAAIAKATGE